MEIQINTDHKIEGHQALTVQISGVVQGALSRFIDHITRVEVHISDESGRKASQNEKRCMMEARLSGRQPIAVTHQASTVFQAVDGAADKLISMIETIIGRQRDQRNHQRDQPTIDLNLPEEQ